MTVREDSECGILTPPAISVIVPVYNAEKYLRRCVDSILAQTFTNFEVLLIDDGSYDGSRTICDEYVTRDQRIRVFHKENGGATFARAVGVGESKANWLTFVDSDDELEPYALKQFASNISGDSDIILGFCEVVIVTNDTISIEQYRANCIAGYRIEPWGKLFRKSLFSMEIFDIPREIVLGEDWIMNIRLAFASRKKVKVLSNPNNIYRYNLDNENRCTKTNKHTLETERKFLQYYNISIPQKAKDRYIQPICEANMFLVLCLLESSCRIPIEKTSSYRFLLSQWKQSGFTIKKQIKLILCYSTITRYVLMKLLKK